MSFRRLVAPVFVAVAVSIAALVALAAFAARQQDAAALAAEKQVLQQEMRSIHGSLAVLAEDNAWWDAAVENISLEENIDWIDSTLGESVIGISQIQGVFIVRRDGTMAYGNFVAALPPPHVFLDAGFADLAKTMEIPENFKPKSTSGFLEIDGDLIAFGASMVQAGEVKSLPPIPDEKRALIIFVSLVGKDDIERIGEDNAVKGLKFTTTPSAEDNTLPVLSHNGDLVGHLCWRPSAPGSEMLRYMVLPASILLVIVIIALGRFLRQANKVLEELARADKAKSAFLASTSHEIRTPLNSIIGFTELISLELYGKVEGEKNKEYLQLIRESGEHLLSIINDILDISKLEADRFEIYAENVDPRAVVASACKLVSASALERGVTLSTDCLPAETLSDERIMRQVLINLLSNAIKFTEPGGSVTVTGLSRGRFYDITITDTGIGMSEHQIETALSLFGQVEGELSRQHSGTGLGLPLVTRFMDLLNGQFDISSKPGAGTTVTVRFPLYREDA
ncbi:ATP-binding protein [Kordiimonas sp.]|uniref:sensor histidine kinase n=1 Tax=Kordiimonas sp. TaxID=1970157 RepID=UPI003A8F8AE6